jgi:hypothetical protein
MLVFEVISEGKSNAWGRTGNKLTRKFRCTFGPRKGRVMASPSSCNKPIDIHRSRSLKQTKAAKGSQIKAKTKITRRTNAGSRRLQTLNKPRRATRRGRKIR